MNKKMASINLYYDNWTEIKYVENPVDLERNPFI